MFDVLRFWLDRGVDGFRVDVLWLLIKDAAFRDNPPNPGYLPTQAAINRTLSIYNADQPEIHEVIAQMRAVGAARAGVPRRASMHDRTGRRNSMPLPPSRCPRLQGQTRADSPS